MARPQAQACLNHLDLHSAVMQLTSLCRGQPYARSELLLSIGTFGIGLLDSGAQACTFVGDAASSTSKIDYRRCDVRHDVLLYTTSGCA